MKWVVKKLQNMEFSLFKNLLKRQIKYMDQFLLWKVESPHGMVYVEVTRDKPEGASDSAYQDLTKDPWESVRKAQELAQGNFPELDPEVVSALELTSASGLREAFDSFDSEEPRMTTKEFLDKILKPLYLEISQKELISKSSAEYNFEDRFSKLSLTEQMDFIKEGVFRYNLQGYEVETLRQASLHEHTLGLESFFEN